MGRKHLKLEGQKFGRLTVLYRTENDKWGNVKWMCVCDCGNLVEVVGWRLRSKHTQSCGCLKHNLSETAVYRTWADMKTRCNNPNRKEYKYYGGRGISICKRWEKFQNFYNDMGDRPEGLTLDRIDNDGNYEPENCRWTTYAEQNHNSRWAKLTKQDIPKIHEMRKSGMLFKEIGEVFDCTGAHIARVVKGEVWANY